MNWDQLYRQADMCQRYHISRAMVEAAVVKEAEAITARAVIIDELEKAFAWS